MSDEKPTPKPEDMAAPGDEQTSRETAADEQAAPVESAGPEAPVPAKPTPEEIEAKKKAALEKAKAKQAAAAAAEPAEPKPPWEEKPVTPGHEDAAADADVAALANALEGAVLGADRFAGDVTVTVPAERIVEICRHLKEEAGFTLLVDLTAVDWPEREEGRFDVVYWVHRFADSKRLRLLAVVPEGGSLPSVAQVWRTANWMEREVYDMFGVIFDGHPNLERILTWEGFNGHPLRKDFPLEGVDTGAAIYPDVYPAGGGPDVAGDGSES